MILHFKSDILKLFIAAILRDKPKILSPSGRFDVTETVIILSFNDK